MKFNSELIEDNRVEEISYKIRPNISDTKCVYRELILSAEPVPSTLSLQHNDQQVARSVPTARGSMPTARGLRP